MIGKRYYDENYGWGTIVAEIETKVLVEYDEYQDYYGVINKEDLK